VRPLRLELILDLHHFHHLHPAPQPPMRLDNRTFRKPRRLPHDHGSFWPISGRKYPRSWRTAVTRLTEVGVLSQVSVGKRNRAFEAKEIINAFTDLERQLASPAGDTRSSEPCRTVPLRPPPLLRVSR